MSKNNYLQYQKEGIDFLTTKYSALLADEQGLGKTVQAIGSAIKLKARRVLVICPASLKLNWLKEFTTWWDLPSNLTYQVVNKGNEAIKRDVDLLIINYDLVARAAIFNQLEDMEFSVGIYDEAHYLKNPKAQRTKAILGKTGIVHRCRYNWMLTGTPILNRPIDLWPMLATLASDLIKPNTSYKSFGRKYCSGWDAPWGFDVSGASNLEQLKNRIKPFMIRRLKKDVLQDLPEKQYQFIPLDPACLSKDVKKITQQLDPHNLKDVTFNDSSVDELATLRRQLAIDKTPSCINYIKDLMEGGLKKLVVFAHHIDVINQLVEGLSSFNPVAIHGSTTVAQRQQAVENFQNDESYRIFVGQIQAAGVGITLTAASHIVFVESSWVPGTVLQAVDRCHRLGQSSSVLAQFLVVQDSIEEHMLKSVVEKLKIINEVTR